MIANISGWMNNEYVILQDGLIANTVLQDGLVANISGWIDS